jgi:hypothetical protein
MKLTKEDREYNKAQREEKVKLREKKQLLNRELKLLKYMKKNDVSYYHHNKD